MKWINLWWGLVNLLPVMPLDGGQITREVIHMTRVRQPWELTLKTSMLVSGAVAAYFLIDQRFGYYPAILFGILCFYNFQMFQQHRGSAGGPW